MIDQSTLTTPLHSLLVAAASLAGKTIERGKRINLEPGRTPWVGVYPGQATSSPHTLGAGSAKWLSKGHVQVVCQTCDYGVEGQEAVDELSALVAAVCAVVNDNLTLGVAGLRIVGAEQDYSYTMVSDSDGAGSIFFPQTVLKFHFEQRSA